MSNIKDITNQKFNRLKVLYRNGSKGGKAVWHCICDCGNECDVIGQYLRNGHTKSCGCYQKEQTGKAAKNNKKDLANQKFGHLTALKPTERRAGSNIIWECICDCGNITYVAGSDLTNLKTKSCGCLRKQSYGEMEIESILIENNIRYKKEYSFQDLKSKYQGIPRYDFAILDNNDNVKYLIEFDGEQHYHDVQTKKWGASFKDIQVSDELKNNYAKEHDIPLIRIPYWERDKITLEMILDSTYEIREAGQPTG